MRATKAAYRVVAVIASFGACVVLGAMPASAAPIAQLSRTELIFGAGLFATTTVQSVFVTNVGDAPLTVASIIVAGTNAADFALSGTCAAAVLAASDRCRIDVVMEVKSGTAATRSATVTITSNASPATNAFSLVGNYLGDISVGYVQSPAYIDFPGQAVGTSATQVLTLAYSESITHVIDKVVFFRGDASAFTLSTDCVGKTLGAGTSCATTIGFNPSAAGPWSTEIEFDSHPSPFPTFKVVNRYSVTGVGTTGGGPAAVNIDQQGLTGSWYQPATSGQGVELEVFPDLVAAGTGFMQGSWFTFDHIASGGADHGRWYTFGGNVQAGSASATLPIYLSTGGNFNALPVTSAVAVGNVVLSFADCTTAQMNYTFTDGSGRSGTVPLTRLTPNVTCTSAGGGSGNADFGLSGNWYDPAKAGQGFVFEVNPAAKIVFFAWYTYAPNGQALGAAGQRWYTGQASYTPGARSIPLFLYETTGGRFDAAAPVPTTAQVGSGTLTFASCNAARLAFTFNAGSNAGQAGSIDLARVGPAPAGCAF